MNPLAIGSVAPLILCKQALAPKQQSTKLISRNGRAPHSRASGAEALDPARKVGA